MKKSHIYKTLLIGGALFLASCGSNTTSSEQQDIALADSSCLDSVVADTILDVPIEWEEGEITIPSKDPKSLVIDYVMAEEPFMSYYTMTESERDSEKNYFRKILNIEQIAPLVKQSKESKSEVKINVIGITSRESFIVKFTSAEL